VCSNGSTGGTEETTVPQQGSGWCSVSHGMRGVVSVAEKLSRATFVIK
jgi:hypothetical protein